MATVTTSGIWSSVNQPLEKQQGLNTAHLSWGVPYTYRKDVNPGKRQSSYQFDGVAGETVLTDGTEFKLGTFTHHNFGLNPPPIAFSTNLKVTLTIDSGGGTREFNFKVDHNETEGWGVPDEVQIPSSQSQETVTIAGTEYALYITGFKQDGKLVSKFISAENRSNSADIFAKLVAVAKPEPKPEPKIAICETTKPVEGHSTPEERKLPEQKLPKPVGEEECRLKSVVNVSTLFSATLERLNRRSVVQLLEQLIAEVNEHCEKQAGPNINITEITQQIEMLNAKLLIIQKAAGELDEKEIGQVNVLIQQLIQKMDFSQVLQNFQISIDGRSFSLQSLVAVLATVDQVVKIQIQYAEGDVGDVIGTRFILSDSTVVIFNVRLVEQPAGQLNYVFETSNWKGLHASFSLVFNRRAHSYKLCTRSVKLDLFDGVEQTNIVFDLCPRIAKKS